MPAQNLPPRSTSFIGREPELAEIARLLANPDCRLLTLTGPGGVGKTRLAIEAARIIVSEPSFLHGVHFVPLQPLTSPDFIVSTITDTLNFPFQGDGDLQTQLLDYLREKRLMLVMDNFEHLMAGAVLFSEILEAAAEIKILVTSRERLHLREEWVLDVGGLPFPPKDTGHAPDRYGAVQLFAQNARRAGYAPVEGDMAAIAHVCRLVEGIPLAIELAAAWVRALPCLEIADEIERSLDMLTTTTRNVPEKHRSMRAAFEHSWKLLTEEEQAVFRKLAVFRGGFRREAARVVAGAPLPVLASLVDRSLMRVDGSGRYSLQELLRQYADYQLERSGEADAVHDAHCAYYAGFLREREPELKGPDQVQALDAIEAELDNVRVSWRHAVNGSREHEIQRAFEGLARFYQMRSYYQEGAQAFEMAANCIGDSPGELLGQILMWQAWFNQYSDRDKQLEAIQKGLMILRQPGDYRAVHMPLRLLCWPLDNSGGYQVVQQFYQDYRATAQKKGDKWEYAWAVHCLGWAAFQEGEFAEAQPYFHESVALFRALGDPWGASWSIGALAMVGRETKNYSEALHYYREHLMLCQEARDVAGVAFSLVGLGYLLNVEDTSEIVMRHFGKALKLAVEVGFGDVIMSCLCWAAEYFMDAEGQAERAVEVLALIRNYRALPYYKNWAARQLDTLQADLPPEVFAAAVRRGEAMDLELTAAALLEEFPPQDEQPAMTIPAAAPWPGQPLPEPLNARELEILRLLADGLNSREVAQHLHLGVSTIRWYLKHIYGKLDAHSRSEALARAKELKLLA
jgi:predicted ATPase/DNA-binding CsgD family transcriptional regulator